MENFTTWSTFTVLSITLIAILLAKLIVRMYTAHNYWTNLGVPYIKGMPMWKFLTRQITFIECCQLMYNSYPDASYVGMINNFQRILIIRDPELIRDIGVKNFDHFMNRQTFLSEETDPLFAKSVSMLHGERWREMRNILTPSFTASKMRFMFELVSNCSKTFIDHLCKNVDNSPIDAKDAFARYTNDVIATVAFGVNVNSLEDRNNEFYMRGKDIMDCIFGSIFKLMTLNLFPRLSIMLGLKAVPSTTTNFFRKVIAQTIKAREEQGIVRPDMLHLLMQARDNKNSTIPLTIDDITSQAFVFFLAGFDSTSDLMCFALYELAQNPDIQEKLRKEVDRYMDEANDEISYEALSKMEYLDMVLSEANRKYPLAIFSDRICMQKYELPPAQPGCNSVTVKPGDMVWIPIYSLHHDPKYFPEPEKFDPERFSAENKENIIPYTYIPFGVGPRRCIGDRFALMENKILMVQLLRKFIIEPSEKMIVPIRYKKSTFRVAPEGGFWINLKKRSV